LYFLSIKRKNGIKNHIVFEAALRRTNLLFPPSNNYRDYSEASLEQLIFIQQAKQLGFTLAEIQKWIQDIKSEQLTAMEKCEIISQKLQEIDERIDELKKMKIPLVTCLAKYQSET